MTKITVIMNPRSGSGKSEELLNILSEHPDTFETILLDTSHDIDVLVTEAARKGAETIAAAGGDGTVSAVASSIVRNRLNVRLGVIPSGTLNHFAKDLKIPLDMRMAVENLLHGKTHQVDMGMANEIYFINNSSLGLYPEIVKKRESLQQKGWGKRAAMLATMISVFKRHPHVHVRFPLSEASVPKKTSFVFVGNNKYAVEGLGIGTRTSVDQGILTVQIAHHVGRFRFAVLGMKALIGSVMREPDFNVVGLQECTITSSKREMLVSYDGEIASMRNPIHYKIVPKALSVIVPA